MSPSGTKLPVVVPPMDGCCQLQSRHWRLVRLLRTRELPLRLPGIFGSNRPIVESALDQMDVSGNGNARYGDYPSQFSCLAQEVSYKGTAVIF